MCSSAPKRFVFLLSCLSALVVATPSLSKEPPPSITMLPADTSSGFSFTAVYVITADSSAIAPWRVLHCPGAPLAFRLARDARHVWIYAQRPGKDGKHRRAMCHADLQSCRLLWCAELEEATPASSRLPFQAISVSGADSISVFSFDDAAPMFRLPSKWRIWLRDTTCIEMDDAEPDEPAAKGEAVAPADSAAASARPNRIFSRQNPVTGKTMWRTPLKLGRWVDWTDFDEDTTDARMLFLVSDGLAGIELGSGRTWSVQREMSKTNTGFTLLKNLGSALAIAGGAGWGTFYPANTTHHLNSAPLATDSLVYVCARAEVLACDSRTGAVRWSTTLPDKEGLRQLRIRNGRLMVVAPGLKLVDNTVKRAGPAGVTMLEARTGALLAHWAPPGDDPIVDCAFDSGHVSVITPQRVFRLTSSLGVVGQGSIPEDHVFFSLAPCADGVVVRSTEGFTRYGGDPFRVLWKTPVEASVILTKKGKLESIDRYFRGKVVTIHPWAATAQIVGSGDRRLRPWIWRMYEESYEPDTTGTWYTSADGFGFIDFQSGRITALARYPRGVTSYLLGDMAYVTQGADLTVYRLRRPSR